MPQLLKFGKPTGDAERATQTTLDTIEVTPQLVGAIKCPPFQREVRINQKVVRLTEEVRRTGVLPGILTLGVLDGATYIVDGQHRLNAFLQAGIPVGYADVRMHYFNSMGEMANEFVQLNSQLVRLRPDDILKGLEQSNIYLQRIRRRCPYIGYSALRRGANAPVLSMATMLRMWAGTRTDAPVMWASAVMVADQLDDAETDMAIEFLTVCYEAWRRDVEYSRLWGALNLSLCGWLWRHVVRAEMAKSKARSDRLTLDQFKRGMMALSAAQDYLEWLVGRSHAEINRAPGYNRVKTILAARYMQDQKSKLRLPSPSWAKS